MEKRGKRGAGMSNIRSWTDDRFGYDIYKVDPVRHIMVYDKPLSRYRGTTIRYIDATSEYEVRECGKEPLWYTNQNDIINDVLNRACSYGYKPVSRNTKDPSPYLYYLFCQWIIMAATDNEDENRRSFEISSWFDMNGYDLQDVDSRFENDFYPAFISRIKPKIRKELITEFGADKRRIYLNYFDRYAQGLGTPIPRFW